MQNKNMQANRIFIQARTFCSNLIRILIYQGYGFFNENNVDEACSCFEKAGNLTPENGSLEHALLRHAESFLSLIESEKSVDEAKQQKDKQLADESQQAAFEIVKNLSIVNQLKFYFLIGLIFEQKGYIEKSKDIFYLCIQAFANFKPALKKLLKEEWYKDLNKISILPSHLSELEYLGSGSYGRVHRGKWLVQEVAIKEMILNKIPKETFLQLIQEAETLKKFDHPNIVHYFGISIDKKPYSLIMEYVRLSLSKYIETTQKQQTIPWLANVQILEGIANGLNFLHTNNVFHRDLKPDNVLLDQNNCPKLIDFGLLKIKDETEEYYLKHPETRSDQYKGTIPYMAPEVLREKGKEGTRERLEFDKADVFSYGMIMWELAKKQSPWKGLESSQIIDKVGHNKNKEKKEMRREQIDDKWPQTYITLMKACWKEKPKIRFSAGQVLTSLKEMKKVLPPDLTVKKHN